MFNKHYLLKLNMAQCTCPGCGLYKFITRPSRHVETWQPPTCIKLSIRLLFKISGYAEAAVMEVDEVL
jgi:hypothetical protein